MLKRNVENIQLAHCEGRWLARTILHMDESFLFQRQMPERTFIHTEAKSMLGCKVFKDKITVSLGGSATGYRLKPFVIWQSENFRASIYQEVRPASAICRPHKVVRASAALPGCPPAVLMPVKRTSTVQRITHLSRCVLLLIMLLDILLLLTIVISVSRSCLFPQTLFVWFNQWIKQLQYLLSPTTEGGTLPWLLLQMRKTLTQSW